MRIHHLGIVEWEGDAIYMLNTHGGARQTSKITTAQISIVASVVNLIMVTLAHILRICNNLESNKTQNDTYFYFQGIDTPITRGPTGLDVCFDVNLFTKELGNQISWSIGCHDKSCTECVSTPESGKDDSEYTQQCCLPANQQSFSITCTDGGDGWTDGYLEINGKRYCEVDRETSRYIKKIEESMPNEKAPEGPG